MSDNSKIYNAKGKIVLRILLILFIGLSVGTVFYRGYKKYFKHLDDYASMAGAVIVWMILLVLISTYLKKLKQKNPVIEFVNGGFKIALLDNTPVFIAWKYVTDAKPMKFLGFNFLVLKTNHHRELAAAHTGPQLSRKFSEFLFDSPLCLTKGTMNISFYELRDIFLEHYRNQDEVTVMLPHEENIQDESKSFTDKITDKLTETTKHYAKGGTFSERLQKKLEEKRAQRESGAETGFAAKLREKTEEIKAKRKEMAEENLSVAESLNKKVAERKAKEQLENQNKTPMQKVMDSTFYGGLVLGGFALAYFQKWPATIFINLHLNDEGKYPIKLVTIETICLVVLPVIIIREIVKKLKKKE